MNGKDNLKSDSGSHDLHGMKKMHHKNEDASGKKTEIIHLRENFIKLGQALKAAGFVESGVDAKFAVQDGEVSVNGRMETQRGRKLVDGDIVEYKGGIIKIEL